MDVGVPENLEAHQKRRIVGGESNALKHLAIRLRAEETAFRNGFYQPNQARPDLLGPPLSLSAAISIGAISVRLLALLNIISCGIKLISIYLI